MNNVGRTARRLSRFMRRTLLPDEKVLFDARFPFMYSVTGFLVMVGFTACGVAVQFLMHKYAVAVPKHIPVFAGAGVGLWQMFWMFMKKWTTEIVLTDQRLIYKRGFFVIRAEEVGVEQLASDRVEQTLLGRLLDYGHVEIRCIEAADLILPDIEQPYAFRNMIEKVKAAHRRARQFGDGGDRFRRHGEGEER